MPPFDELPHLSTIRGMFFFAYGPERRAKAYAKNKRLRVAWETHHGYWSRQIELREARIAKFDADVKEKTIAALRYNEAVAGIQESAARGENGAKWELTRLVLEEYFDRVAPESTYRFAISHDSRRVIAGSRGPARFRRSSREVSPPAEDDW